MGAIPLDKAYLTAIWLETLFYGGPGAFFSDVSIPANVAKVCLHTVNSILGDSIVVWRCYHVWGKSWLICIFPVMLITGSAVSGFGQTVVFAQAKTSHSAFVHTLQLWNGCVFSFNLVTNVVVTSLIAFRIWHLGRQLNFGSSFRYRRVLTLVVESGLIYSTAVAIEITLYFLNSNAFYIVYDPIAQLTAIVPTMIIVMACLGLTSNDLNDMQTKMTIETNGPQFAANKAPRTTTLGTESMFGARSADPRSTTGSVFVEIKGSNDSEEYELSSAAGSHKPDVYPGQAL
ncbi:hypothetical protein CPB85DRAFT_1249833 [Mucidula mucida]|nr:hypothetical protein CPB85DRAFT_1249833 [Mucidula mucida]